MSFAFHVVCRCLPHLRLSLNTAQFSGSIPQELKDNVKAHVALKDALFSAMNVINNRDLSLYAVACRSGASLVTAHAIAEAVKTDTSDPYKKFNDAAGNSPLTTAHMLMMQERTVPAGYESFWIPGDWGNIENLNFDKNNPAHTNRDGENMIYLGGCYETEFEAFKANALFWGNGMGSAHDGNPAENIPPAPYNNIMTLEQMMYNLRGWGQLRIHSIRRDIRPEYWSNKQ